MAPDPDTLDVAIVGAGPAGLTAGRALTQRGARVRLFDKGRGPGGRASTRRAEAHRFDHGAQYFTARDPRFAQEVARLSEAGVVAEWPLRLGVRDGDGLRGRDRAEPRYVGRPQMSALCRAWARDLDVRWGRRITALRRQGGGWHLLDATGAVARADALLVATPAPQAAEILASAAPDLAARAAAVRMAPCWAAMAAFAAPVEVPFDGIFVNDAGPLSWVARDSSKPGRPAGERWVLHATPAWSRAHLEDDAEGVAEALRAALFEALDAPAPAVEHLAAHRWRYALADAPLNEGALVNRDLRAAVCGDWCAGSRVEGAFLSGLFAASWVAEPA